MIKKIVKKIVPPIFGDVYRWISGKISPPPPSCFYGVDGNFSSWQDALDYCAKYNHTAGYESTAIIDKVANAIQEVRKGNAEFERDSVLFYKKEYNFQLLSALFLAFNGVDKDKSIQIVDFGGSLGSTFFQNRSLFSMIKQPIIWNVVEQKHFVDRGKKEVPDVNFYYTVDEYIKGVGEKDILLLSSVLEYMEDPFEMLNSLIEYDWKYVIIERSQYSPYGENRIMVQTVPPIIYDAQYPLWLRSEEKQHAVMSAKGYEKVLDWVLPFSMQYKDERGTKTIPFKGFLYKKGNK